MDKNEWTQSIATTNQPRIAALDDFADGFQDMDQVRSLLGPDRYCTASEIILDPTPVVEVLKKGGMVILPTDTLYGLITRVEEVSSLEKLYRVKGRSLERQVPVLIDSPEYDLPRLVEEIPPLAQKLIDRCWPGPLTLVLKAKTHLPKLLIGHQNAIGVRQSPSSVVRAVLSELGEAVTGTSANLSGGRSPFSLTQISPHILKKAQFVVDGGTLPGRKGSTVIDFTREEIHILRQGDLPLNRVREIIQV